MIEFQHNNLGENPVFLFFKMQSDRHWAAKVGERLGQVADCSIILEIFVIDVPQAELPH